MASLSRVYGSDHFATISDDIVRCLTWSSPVHRLIAALGTLRSASSTSVIDLHFKMSNWRTSYRRFKQTFPSSRHVPFGLHDVGIVQVAGMS